MYHKIRDFLEDFKRESGATLNIFNNLTDTSLSQKVYEEGRNLGFLAWHIVISIGEMGGKIGITVDCPPEDSEPPKTAKAIADSYYNASATLYSFVEKNWKNEKLMEEVKLYGKSWKNGFTLGSLIVHEIHHRGQMTVLMRQAGLKVPGIYGPAKEEWQALGMPSPK